MDETLREADLQREVLGGVVAVAVSTASALDKPYVAMNVRDNVAAAE